MTSSEPGSSTDGAGRKTGSIPLSLRKRARRLYRERRKTLMEVPTAALRQQYGSAVVADDELFQSARVELSDRTIEVGFHGRYRMFGALIDTQWVGLKGILGASPTVFEYRFDKLLFIRRMGNDDGLGARLSDATTARLAARSELKSIKVEDDGGSRRVVITPLPGTITAVYFPPMPPYSIPIKPAEARDHIELLEHLLVV